MSSCFCKPVPRAMLQELLEMVAGKVDEQTYRLRHVDFQRAKFYNHIEHWRTTLRPYYKPCKQYYLDRQPFTYVHFATIVRQVCKSHGVAITSHLEFDRSKYDMVYDMKLQDESLCTLTQE